MVPVKVKKRIKLCILKVGYIYGEGQIATLSHSLTDAPLTHDVCFHSTMVGIILDCRHRYGQLQIQQRSGQLSSKRTF